MLEDEVGQYSEYSLIMELIELIMDESLEAELSALEADMQS